MGFCSLVPRSIFFHLFQVKTPNICKFLNIGCVVLKIRKQHLNSHFQVCLFVWFWISYRRDFCCKFRLNWVIYEFFESRIALMLEITFGIQGKEKWWEKQETCKIVTSVSSVQSLSCVPLFVTPRTAACQASLSITSSWSSLKLMSIDLVMPSNHLILCRPLLLLPSIFPSIRVFSNAGEISVKC